MELPQSRLLETKGGKATHDFLSLYSSSTADQDPAPRQGSLVKTHDFLQPLELFGAMARQENTSGGATQENHPTGEPLFARRIGATCSSISYFGQSDGPWEESAPAVKGKTGKENGTSGRSVLPEVDTVGGQWISFSEKPSNQKSATAISSMQCVSSPVPSKKKRSFMDVITSAKNNREEEKTESAIKTEISPVKLETKKSSTTRSKHSATEQRRRSKINDRFQKLREIIPNSEQKKDKASFLLEVIDYVKFLQERVDRFEGACNSSKLTPWNQTTESTSQQNVSVAGDMNEQGVAIKSGTVNISSIYSQGLLSSIKQALQESGVDLSQSRISVKINLGKRSASSTLKVSTSTHAHSEP